MKTGLYFWILWHYAKSGRRFFDLHTVLTILGVAVGVAVLVVSMSAFSGFETGLKSALKNITGEVSLYKRGGYVTDVEGLMDQLGPLRDDTSSQSSFLNQQSMVAHKGQIRMILLQGVEVDTVDDIVQLSSRLVEGELDWSSKGEIPASFIGKELAQQLGLKVGDKVTVIIPKGGSADTALSTKATSFVIRGVLDLGKYEYNSRFLFTQLKALQGLLKTKGVTGLRFRLKEEGLSQEWATQAQELLGWGFIVRDWQMMNHNFLSAIEYEKKIIFFVVLILVFAACFNVANTLFVSVLKRYRDISLLKTLGATSLDVLSLFCWHGLIIGGLGLFGGLGLGLAINRAFDEVQKHYPILPSDVYQLSSIATELRTGDALMITGATLIICFFSTLLPAFKGGKLSPVEGLKYE